MALHLARIARPRDPRPLRRRHHRDAQRGQRVRDGLGVPGGAEDAEDACRGDAHEEVLEVEPHDGRPAGVQRRMGADGTAGNEAVGGVVLRDVVEDLVEDPALDLLQPQFRPRDRPGRAVRARLPAVGVVAQAAVGRVALEPAGVREPHEPAGVELQEVGELARRRDPRRGPRHPAHLRREVAPAQDVRPSPVALERQLDVGGELARAVGRRARVGLEDPAHDGPQPSRARGQHLAAAAHHRGLRPGAGEEVGCERGAELSSAGSGGHPDRDGRWGDSPTAPVVRARAGGSSRWAHAMHCVGVAGPPGVPRRAIARRGAVSRLGLPPPGDGR